MALIFVPLPTEANKATSPFQSWCPSISNFSISYLKLRRNQLLKSYQIVIVIGVIYRLGVSTPIEFNEPFRDSCPFFPFAWWTNTQRNFDNLFRLFSAAEFHTRER
jgi:hypothetical protein